MFNGYIAHSHFTVLLVSPADDVFFNDDCSALVGAFWTYESDEETQFFSDLDNSGFIDAGDAFIFNEAPIAVTIDNTLIASGNFAGTCTATPDLTPEREYCVLTYDFGDLGTLAVQGPLEAMSFVGTTGCFSFYEGELNGFLAGSIYTFVVNADTR